MIKRTLLSILTAASLSEMASAVEINLEQCASAPQGVTDISFVAPGRAIVSTQPGDLYWFNGCNRPMRKMGNIADVSSNGWEDGLYGVAANWQHFGFGRLFAYYTTEKDGELFTRLSSFRFGRNGVSDKQVLLEIPQPYSNKNGGGLRFGPDGALYVGIGDGGSEAGPQGHAEIGDPLGNAQNVENIYGSVLRIYPSFMADDVYFSPSNNLRKFVPNAAPEILAYGLSNPWKIAFDSKGDLIIADVGLHTTEEVSLIPGSAIGEQALNLGWSIKEGNGCFDQNTQSPDPDASCTVENEITPIHTYEHASGAGNSITGGETLWMGGKEYYLFADFMTGYLGALDLENPENTVAERTETGKNWATFAKSPMGEVFVSDYTNGVIYRVTLRP
ncbi:MAG: PQQ-dependent sugar dehydrogenase [Reinekea sp.]